MEAGRILQTGSVADALENPATASIARLFEEQLSTGPAN
jgi:ABC-type sulfate/molybdate transport systems ATPase subunit